MRAAGVLTCRPAQVSLHFPLHPDYHHGHHHCHSILEDMAASCWIQQWHPVLGRHFLQPHSDHVRWCRGDAPRGRVAFLIKFCDTSIVDTTVVTLIMEH